MLNPINDDPNFELVHIQILKASRGSYWYYKMVGEVLEVRKRINPSGATSYEYMSAPSEAGEHAFFDNNDVQEVTVS